MAASASAGATTSMPLPGQAQVVALGDGAGLADAGAHGPGHLPGDHPAGALGHEGDVGVGVALGVVFEQGREALLDAAGRDDPDRLRRPGGRLARRRGRCCCCWAGPPPASPGAASMAASRSAVEGFIDCPPLTTWWTPSDRKMRRMPSPVHTATDGAADRCVRRLQSPTAGRPPPAPNAPPRPAPTGRRPGSGGGGPPPLPASMAAPDVVGVDVAVPQTVAADTTIESPETGPHLTERRDRLVGRFEQVHDLVTEPGAVVAARPGFGAAGVAARAVRGRRPGRRARAGRRRRGGGRQTAGAARHRRRRPRRPPSGPAADPGCAPGRRARLCGPLRGPRPARSQKAGWRWRRRRQPGPR